MGVDSTIDYVSFLENEVERLRKRTHQIQERADKKISELEYENTNLKISLTAMEGVEVIGQKVFWDICKCNERPLYLSMNDAKSIGAKVLSNMIGVNNEME